MRVVLFASGGAIPAEAVRALRGTCDLVGVVRPRASVDARGPARLARRVWRGARALARRSKQAGPEARDPLDSVIAESALPVWPMRGPNDPALEARLRAAAVDVACIATFPWRLGASLLGAARAGTLNVHTSLLPRHRGPTPLFWTYHADDREAGVTIHRADSRMDAGPIVAQARLPLPRGHPVRTLHAELAEVGASLLRDAVVSMADGTATLEAQDERLATQAPRVQSGERMLGEDWGAERTWHFLAGLAGMYREPLWCDGREVRYREVPGYTGGSPLAVPGVVTRATTGPGWTLWCRDGGVTLLPDDA
ncbi:MAG: hypothetical protein KJZ74_14910 [Gemmatimonadales bacterium]|nr:hypothetical protein [Gemmatimonadales bacterium]